MKQRKYRRPVTNPQDKDFGFNVDVDPLAEPIQYHLTAKQERVVEIALDHLDELRELGVDGPVDYATNLLAYNARPAKADVTMLVGAVKTHLRQAHVLTQAERNELLGIEED